MIEISGKRNRKVPILLTPETKTAEELVIEKRLESILQENMFVFARASKGSLGHLRGWDSVSDNVKEIEATLKKPKEITNTKLQKIYSNSLLGSRFNRSGCRLVGAPPRTRR